MKMKNLLNKLFLFGILGSFVLLYSCGGDDTEEPAPTPPSLNIAVTGGTLNADQTELTANLGTLLNFTVTVTAPGGFNTFVLTQGGTNQEINRQSRADLNLDAGTTTAVITVPPFSFTAGQTATLEFLGVDDAGLETTATVTVTLVGTTANRLTAQLLFVPSSDGGTVQDSKTFFSSTVAIDDENVFSVDDVQTDNVAINSIDIDFGFFQGLAGSANSSEINLASPSNYAAYDLTALGWTNLNETTMKLTTLDASAFNETTTVEQISAAFDAVAGDGSANLANLAVGNVIAMRTDADKDGGSKLLLVLIKDQIDANNNGEFDDVGDYVELEVLIEP